MKTFLHFPANRFEKYRVNYTLIRRSLLTAGSTLSLDWYEEIEKTLRLKKEANSQKLMTKAIGAISSADYIISEASNFTFDSAYVINKSKDLKKPTLLLIDSNIELSETISEEISKIKHSYCSIERYYAQDIPGIITKFINQNSNSPVSRFNLMIEKKQRDYLDWAEKFYKQSKSGIIRELVNDQSRNDRNYQLSGSNVT